MIQYPTLSIAGFDPSGGAGLQADLKTFTVFGCYGMTVLTALAVQNTTGVKSCYSIPINAIQEQLDAVFQDIPPKAIKLGMLFNEEIIDVVVSSLKKYAANIPLVLDPVMRAKSGDALLLPSAEHSLITKLLPLSTIVTPNLPEAYALIGEDPSKKLTYEEIGTRILATGVQAVLVKGGHDEGSESRDLLMTTQGVKTWLSAPRINTKNSHGTGCTISAAITACLAQGLPLEEAVPVAKRFLTQALDSASKQSVGSGAGPTDHTWMIADHPQQNWKF
ncbi:MAG: bifunctional hydroxymethylpyrimidine kinase/phosphomethylpyrimidine kinase [Brevinema sp.]